MPSRFEFERAIRRSGLPPLARLIALVIATWADADTGAISRKNQPAQSVLLEATGMSKSAFLSHRKTLLDSGWLRCVTPDRIKAQKEHAQNVYSIQIPDGWAGSGDDLAFLGEVGHEQDCPRSPDDLAHSDKSESSEKARSSGDLAPSEMTDEAGSGGDLAKTDEVRPAPEKLGRQATTRVLPTPLTTPPTDPVGGGEQAGDEERIPDAFAYIQPLIRAMTDAEITVSWMASADDYQKIARVLQRAGVEAMVEFAVNTKATARKPISYATFFLRGWLGLPPKSTKPRPKADPNLRADWPPHCGDDDCDERTRLRDVEVGNGLWASKPCPQCHPSRKESAA
jgi:hypothetical protein